MAGAIRRCAGGEHQRVPAVGQHPGVGGQHRGLLGDGIGKPGVRGVERDAAPGPELVETVERGAVRGAMTGHGERVPLPGQRRDCVVHGAIAQQPRIARRVEPGAARDALLHDAVQVDGGDLEAPYRVARLELRAVEHGQAPHHLGGRHPIVTLGDRRDAAVERRALLAVGRVQAVLLDLGEARRPERVGQH